MPLVFALLAAPTGCAEVATGIRVLAHRTNADPTEIRAGRYATDPDHRFLVLEVGHLGFSHVLMRFEEWRATIEIDPQAPEDTRVTAEIAADTLSTGVPAIDAQLRRLLQADRHPTIRFVSRGLTRTGPATARLVGTLTMAGRSAPATLDVTFNGAGRNPLTGRYTLGFSARGAIERSRWGLGRWIPAVGDRVDFRIEAEFVASPAPVSPSADED